MSVVNIDGIKKIFDAVVRIGLILDGPSDGMNTRDIMVIRLICSRFSVLRLLRYLADNGKPEGFAGGKFEVVAIKILNFESDRAGHRAVFAKDPAILNGTRELFLYVGAGIRVRSIIIDAVLESETHFIANSHQSTI